MERNQKSQSGPDLPPHPLAKLRQKKKDAGRREKRGREHERRDERGRVGVGTGREIVHHAAGPSARLKPQNSTATVMPFCHHCQVTTE